MKYNSLFIQSVKKIDSKKRYGAAYFRREFNIYKEIETARLLMTSCGIYKAYINGTALDVDPFMPGCTYYHKRLQIQEYNVISMLSTGKNAIAAVVGDGWYRGEIGASSKRNVYGKITKLLAVIKIRYTDGSEDIITTDEKWKITQKGPVVFNDLKGGEIYDATLEMTGWTSIGFNDENWQTPFQAEYSGEIIPTEGEKIREHEVFTPEIITTPDGSLVLDFGQNIFGYMEFSVNGEKGQTVNLIHGETLDENKNFTQKNLFMMKVQAQSRFQKLTYTLRDGRQNYKPMFSAYGFRYVKVENWPEKLLPENFKAYAVYSDMKQTGNFECSNELLNQLVKNTRWSQKGNFMDIPTDCPTRERAGWTGDIEAFCETGTYLMDIKKFLEKWLNDLKAQQMEDGCVQSIVPDVNLNVGNGSAGWADACIIVPYVLYKVYGDESVLRNQYESMTKWMAFLKNRAGKNSVFSIFKSKKHKPYTIDTGWHFGEWLEPGHSMIKDSLKAYIIADSEVATAYYAYSTRLMSEISTILGMDEKAREYSDLYLKIKSAYNYNFLDKGIIKSDRQARYVRPIALDLIGENEKKENAKILNEMVIKNDYKIGTGFLTTQYVLDVLTEYGYTQTAYSMIENTEKPSWLYNVKQGATTILEDWEGIDENGVPKNSFNHYAFGTVVKWLFKYCAGISSLEPGFKKVKISPKPGGSLIYVKCSYDSPKGLINVDWKIENSIFELNAEIPVSGEINMPDGKIYNVEKGQYNYQCEWK